MGNSSTDTGNQAGDNQTQFRNVAITGASAGIGLALARKFAESGCEVASIARSKDRLEAACDKPNLHPFQLDVTDAKASLDVFGEIEKKLGTIDVLIANAGIYPKELFLEQSPESFSETFRVNVDGVANAVRAVLPGMLARNKGRIVVMGSEADYRPIPTAVSYSASKGALHALVRGFAAEIDPETYPNVLVNELAPDATQTAMSEFGQPPEAVFDFVKPLVDLKPGDHHGQFFRKNKHVYLGETWKGTIKRVFFGIK